MVSGDHLDAQSDVGVHGVSCLDAAVIADTELPVANIPVEPGDGRRHARAAVKADPAGRNLTGTERAQLDVVDGDPHSVERPAVPPHLTQFCTHLVGVSADVDLDPVNQNPERSAGGQKLEPATFEAPGHDRQRLRGSALRKPGDHRKPGPECVPRVGREWAEIGNSQTFAPS